MSYKTAGSEMTRAKDRLRIIEQISKYREEKLKQEFDKLEDELQEDRRKYFENMQRQE